ncbi:uncharacterized protein LY89DRAFT_45422 [Mollisia scopiformis]|uniref:Uncharacterized protein n=1 Tax=Mollisia scopiformis TaxID=149040 RepID=A0A194XDT3_MOLSC|nr:uncharacterized protein LY89DRAFT_45422 [Mollisia scopiformis]KUJ18311.1 hypothetical protein LY89DRAFT_45422 [Mollisia scopiformis]
MRWRCRANALPITSVTSLLISPFLALYFTGRRVLLRPYRDGFDLATSRTGNIAFPEPHCLSHLSKPASLEGCQNSFFSALGSRVVLGDIYSRRHLAVCGGQDSLLNRMHPSLWLWPGKTSHRNLLNWTEIGPSEDRTLCMSSIR